MPINLYPVQTHFCFFVAGHFGDLGRGIRLGRGRRGLESADARTTTPTEAVEFKIKVLKKKTQKIRSSSSIKKTRSKSFEETTLKKFEKKFKENKDFLNFWILVQCWLLIFVKILTCVHEYILHAIIL